MTPETLDRLARRVVLDALLEGSRRYWVRRAEAFEAVGTPAADEIARACRARASLCERDDLLAEEFAELLGTEFEDGAA